MSDIIIRPTNGITTSISDAAISFKNSNKASINLSFFLHLYHPFYTYNIIYTIYINLKDAKNPE